MSLLAVDLRYKRSGIACLLFLFPVSESKCVFEYQIGVIYGYKNVLLCLYIVVLSVSSTRIYHVVPIWFSAQPQSQFQRRAACPAARRLAMKTILSPRCRTQCLLICRSSSNSLRLLFNYDLPMEPLSITTGCLSLVGTITKVSITISTFVRTARDARSDLDSISRELLSLKTVLELLADDTQETPKSIPPTLEKQVSSIISNCDDVLQDIEKSLQKYEKVKRASAKWAWEGRDEIGRLRTTLEAHKSALELALDMVALYDAI